MLMTPLAAAALAMMTSLSPPDAPHETLPGWAETPTTRLERYNRIAVDVAAVVEETCAKAPDDRAVAHCQHWALPVMIGISFHESGWAADVDAGRCYRGRDGTGPRCDGGSAHSIFQLRAGGEEAKLYDTDRRAAAHEALRRATRSWNASKHLERALRWAIYAGGNSRDPMAQRRSRELDAAIQHAAAAWPAEETLVAASDS